MAKKVYLIDTENVGSVWVNILPTLTKQDKLLLFYTVHSSGISYSDLTQVVNQSDKFEMVECFTGRNGLDFQLVSYLGFLIKSSSKAEYIIISNDSGYDAAVRFWSSRDINVYRLKANQLRNRISEMISGDVEKDEEKTASDKAQSDVTFVETENVDNVEEVEQYEISDDFMQEPIPESDMDFSVWLPEDAQIDNDLIMQVFKQAQNKEMQKIYVGMVKSFGQAQGGVVYHALKPHIEEIYELMGC